MRSRAIAALILVAVSALACSRAPAPVEPASAPASVVSVATGASATPPAGTAPAARDGGGPNDAGSNEHAPDPSGDFGLTAPKHPGDADDVREAAFRYMFKKNASGAQQSAHVFCIGLADKDPPAAFLSRLRDVRPTVKPSSACDASARNGVTDRSSGQRGLMFHVDDGIRWVDADHAEIDGGYYEAGLSASGNTYFAERKNGKWVVIKDVMHWIS